LVTLASEEEELNFFKRVDEFTFGDKLDFYKLLTFHWIYGLEGNLQKGLANQVSHRLGLGLWGLRPGKLGLMGNPFNTN